MIVLLVYLKSKSAQNVKNKIIIIINKKRKEKKNVSVESHIQWSSLIPHSIRESSTVISNTCWLGLHTQSLSAPRLVGFEAKF